MTEVQSSDPRFSITMVPGQKPLPEFVEKAIPGETTAFMRVEMSADEVDAFNRYNFPYWIKPTKEFEEWAETSGILFETIEREFQLVVYDLNLGEFPSTLQFTFIVFKSSYAQMLFKLAWM